MEILLLITIFLSFLTTFLVMPFWIKRAHLEKLTGRDMNKRNKKKVAEGGGIPVLAGFIIGVLFYIAIRTFYFKDNLSTDEIFALLSVVLIASIVGMIDDLLGWKKGLSKKIRILMLVFAAIPLMVINAGNSTMMGINLGLLYPLLIIPLGVIGATSTFNFIAGYNSLEAGQGILILSALSLVVFKTGNRWLSLVALCMVGALAAFYFFNKYPAKIFPGDVLTYSVGSLIATIAIIGNTEKIALFFFIPYAIETILKLRGKLKKESFAKVNKKGGLEMPYKKIYGLEHLAIYMLKKIRPDKQVTENQVVYLINGFQIIIILLGFLLFL